MGRAEGWVAEGTGQAPMRSPGSAGRQPADGREAREQLTEYFRVDE